MAEPDTAAGTAAPEALEGLTVQFRTLAGLHAVRRRFGLASPGNTGQAEMTRLVGDALAPAVREGFAALAATQRGEAERERAAVAETLRRIDAAAERAETGRERDRRELEAGLAAMERRLVETMAAMLEELSAGEPARAPTRGPWRIMVLAWAFGAAAAFVAGLLLAPQLRDPLLALLARAMG